MRQSRFPTYIRFRTRDLMIALAVLAVEGVVLMEASKLGPGVEFTLFIGSVLFLLDLLIPAYLAQADRINRAPPEKQAGELFAMGCVMALIMVFLVPVALVVLLRAR